MKNCLQLIVPKILSFTLIVILFLNPILVIGKIHTPNEVKKNHFQFDCKKAINDISIKNIEIEEDEVDLEFLSISSETFYNLTIHLTSDNLFQKYSVNNEPYHNYVARWLWVRHIII